MPYKNREVQPEFFVNTEEKKRVGLLKKGLFHINYTSPISITFDNLIVIIIIALLVNLMSYVFGMEKGKGLAKLSDEKQITNTQTNVNEEVATPAESVTEKENSITKARESIEKEKTVDGAADKKIVKQETINVATTSNKGYYIQLVSCRDNNNANKTLDQLKAAGYSSFIKKQGNYFVIYSGLYDNKKSALDNMTQLKKKYKDCFVCNFKK